MGRRFREFRKRSVGQSVRQARHQRAAPCSSRSGRQRPFSIKKSLPAPFLKADVRRLPRMPVARRCGSYFNLRTTLSSWTLRPLPTHSTILVKRESTEGCTLQARASRPVNDHRNPRHSDPQDSDHLVPAIRQSRVVLVPSQRGNALPGVGLRSGAISTFSSRRAPRSPPQCDRYPADLGDHRQRIYAIGNIGLLR